MGFLTLWGLLFRCWQGVKNVLVLWLLLTHSHTEFILIPYCEIYGKAEGLLSLHYMHERFVSFWNNQKKIIVISIMYYRWMADCCSCPIQKQCCSRIMARDKLYIGVLMIAFLPSTSSAFVSSLPRSLECREWEREKKWRLLFCVLGGKYQFFLTFLNESFMCCSNGCLCVCSFLFGIMSVISTYVYDCDFPPLPLTLYSLLLSEVINEIIEMLDIFLCS